MAADMFADSACTRSTGPEQHTAATYVRAVSTDSVVRTGTGPLAAKTGNR